MDGDQRRQTEVIRRVVALTGWRLSVVWWAAALATAWRLQSVRRALAAVGLADL